MTSRVSNLPSGWRESRDDKRCVYCRVTSEGEPQNDVNETGPFRGHHRVTSRLVAASGSKLSCDIQEFLTVGDIVGLSGMIRPRLMLTVSFGLAVRALNGTTRSGSLRAYNICQSLAIPR